MRRQLDVTYILENRRWDSVSALAITCNSPKYLTATVQDILLTKISVGYQSLQHSTSSSVIIYFQLVRETPPSHGQVVDFE